MKFSSKKLLGALLALFILCLSACLSSRGSAPIVEGYTLTDAQEIPMVQGTVFTYVHNKSGAHIHYVQNNDTNLSFNVAVSTPTRESKGLPHILEHMMLSSTDKYPGKEMFFGVANTTLNTYINAFTAATYTMFPLSTTDEKQFTQLADYYMSAVFEPTLDNNTFMREAWRYELANNNDPLIIKGIVYNEMQGANANIIRAAINASREALFPDTLVRFDSGGAVDTIPTLSVEEVQEYHDTYYIPSNSIIGVYGDLDIIAFLDFLDKQWLSHYTDVGDIQQIAEQKPFSESKTIVVDFPATQNAPTEKKSIVSKSYAISNLNESDIPALFLYLSLLDNPASPLMEELQQKALADQYFLSLNPATRQMQVDFIAQNIDSKNAIEFESIVLNQIEKTAKQGFDAELFESLKAEFFSDGLLARENTGIGIDLINDMASGKIIFDSPYAFASTSYDAQEVTMKEVQDIAKKLFLQNNHSALVTVNPIAGLTEELAQKEIDRLAKVKESLTTQEVNALVEQTESFTQWLNSPDTEGEKSLKKLQVLQPENLENIIETVTIEDTTTDGVRYLYTAVPGEVQQTDLIINLSHLNTEELHYAKMYANLLGQMGTTSLDYKQVGNQLSLKTLGSSFSVSAFYDSYLRTASYPVFTISLLTQQKNNTAAEELLANVLFNTVLDQELLTIKLNEFKASAERASQSNAVSLAVQRATAAASRPYSVQEYLSGLPYIQFVLQLAKEYETEPEKVIKKLEAVSAKMLTQNGLTVLIAGENWAPANLIAQLNPSMSSSTEQYIVPTPPDSTAVYIRDTVNYSAVAESIHYEDRITAVIASDILSNEYYTPKIRLEGGAYGGSSGVNRTVFYAYSLRDPNIAQTLSVFKNTNFFNASLTKESLAPYIIARYGTETAPLGIYTQANINMINYLRGFTPQMKFDDIQKLKTMSPATVQEFISGILSAYSFASFGSASAIDNSGIAYDTIIDMTK